MTGKEMELGTFIDSGICPDFDGVEVNVCGIWRLAARVEDTGTGTFEVTCWNGDVYVLPAWAKVSGWRKKRKTPRYWKVVTGTGARITTVYGAEIDTARKVAYEQLSRPGRKHFLDVWVADGMPVEDDAGKVTTVF